MKHPWYGIPLTQTSSQIFLRLNDNESRLVAELPPSHPHTMLKESHVHPLERVEVILPSLLGKMSEIIYSRNKLNVSYATMAT